MSELRFLRVAPYAEDEMNLPVADVEASIPFYERTFGCRVVRRLTEPYNGAVLARDDVQFAICENGGDPSQEGCFFEVSDVEVACREIRGEAAVSDFRTDSINGTDYRVFFVIAPDGLCYMIGQATHKN